MVIALPQASIGTEWRRIAPAASSKRVFNSESSCRRPIAIYRARSHASAHVPAVLVETTMTATSKFVVAKLTLYNDF